MLLVLHGCSIESSALGPEASQPAACYDRDTTTIQSGEFYELERFVATQLCHMRAMKLRNKVLTIADLWTID
jgi:hypothetical protein